MTPDDYLELEKRLKELDDASLRRIVFVDSGEYQAIAVDVARDELRRRRIPLLSTKGYWEQHPEEWLAGVGFCFRCWSATTDESPEQPWALFGFGTVLIGDQDDCTDCGSTIKRMWLRIVVPVVPLEQYRVLHVRGFRRGRRLRSIVGETSEQRAIP